MKMGISEHQSQGRPIWREDGGGARGKVQHTGGTNFENDVRIKKEVKATSA